VATEVVEPAEGSKKATKGKLYPGGASFKWCFNESHGSPVRDRAALPQCRLLLLCILSQKGYNNRFPLLKFRAMES
jgi:hypothetical protein